MPVTISRGSIDVCDVRMTLNRKGDPLEITRMFDHLGTETFDPTDAAEVEINGRLVGLKEGDSLAIEVMF